MFQTTNRFSRILFCFVLAGSLGIAINSANASEHVGSPDQRVSATRIEPKVVYGNDDRMDVYAYTGDPYWADTATPSVAALVNVTDIDDSDPSDITFPYASTLEEDFELCSTERFGNQLSAAFCSGTLIDDDLVLTSGECIQDELECLHTRLVFRYQMLDQDTLETIEEDDVFSCQEIVVSQTGDVDFAIIRLDRPATPRFEPAIVTGADSAVPEGTPLAVIGCPSGIPLKIDDGGQVRESRESTLDYFVANLDTFGGNSGSPVWRQDTQEVVGIVVRGESDYVWNSQDQCYVVNVCGDTECRGEDSTYVYRAIEAFCSEGQSNRLCGPYCGDGTCDPDESSQTCPDDCGTSCGDGVCNGTETVEGCPEDCAVCGDGICSPGETVESCLEDCTVCGDGYCAGAETYLTCESDCFCGDDVCDTAEDRSFCCLDCGCPSAWECQDNACELLQGDGDSCEGGPIVIEAIPGTTSYVGDTASASGMSTGSCGGGAATERVYAFTLDFRTDLEAQVTGYDTVLYLRADCLDPASELACNDDSDPPGDYGSRISISLEAGTYFLFVDGYSGSSGAYELIVEFLQQPCFGDTDCEDGVFCNGAETCIDQVCQAGTSPCDDGSGCSDDICVETRSECVHRCNAVSREDPCCEESVCSSEDICQAPPYPQSANTVAASYGNKSLLGSGVFNSLAIVLLPVGGLICLGLLRKKK